MSVINHVLQQLEQRRAGLTGQTSGPALVAVRAKQPRRLAVIVVLGVGAISMAALGDWPTFFKPPVKAPLPGVAQATAVPEAASAPLPAAPVAAVQVAMAPPVAFAPPVVAPAVAPAAEPTAPAMPARARTRVAAASAPAPATPAFTLALPHPRPLAPPLPSISKTTLPEAVPARAQALWRQAQESAQAGHRQLAIERATEALQLEPTLHDARYLAAALMAESGRAAEAETLLRAGTGPQSAVAAALLARLLAERGDADGALQLLDQHQLRDADAQGLRGVLYARQGNPARARVAYEAALAQRPQQSTWWLGLAITFEAEQMAPQARQAFERATLLGLAEPELAAYAETRLRALAR